MRAWRWAALYLGFVLALWGGCAWAQTYPVGKIVFTGSDLSQAELLAFTGLRPGGQVTREQMQAVTDRLTGTGLFSDVRFGFDGTTLTFAVEPSAAIVPVEYDNFPWWDDKALHAAVAAQVPLFHGAISPGGSMRDQVRVALTSLLAAKGVQGAVITTSAVGNESHDQVAIRYHIDTPPVVIANFQIYGYSGVWTQPLQALERAAFGEKIDGSVRQKLADEVRGVYGKLGFIAMTMTAPAWGQPHLVNGEVAVPVSISITSEGGQYHVSAVHLNGDVFMTQEQFAASAKLHPGDVANEDVWKQVQAMVEAPYRTHGYLDAKIDATPVLHQADHTVDYTIAVEPGPVYHMGKLTLANLDEKQKAELMPYWLLHKGDMFDADLIPKSVAEYHRLRAEDEQSIRTGFTARWTADQDTHTVDVVLTFNAAGK
jgi:outer membrane protein assembly factor BamA